MVTCVVCGWLGGVWACFYSVGYKYSTYVYVAVVQY